MKNQMLLDNYYLPGNLNASIGEYVDHYNTERYHESLNNVTPEHVYTGGRPNNPGPKKENETEYD